jgi:hypothetical protein
MPMGAPQVHEVLHMTLSAPIVTLGPISSLSAPVSRIHGSVWRTRLTSIRADRPVSNTFAIKLLAQRLARVHQTRHRQSVLSLRSGRCASSVQKVLFQGVSPVPQVIETEGSEVRVVQDGVGGAAGADSAERLFRRPGKREIRQLVSSQLLVS